ncbi:hypothetical protein HanRHA438_Chr03g0114781 [Helianthus annuus]|nr:hypothetical protein HanRHA438_Chr03g0114781 [Helianthus annuus]
MSTSYLLILRPSFFLHKGKLLPFVAETRNLHYNIQQDSLKMGTRKPRSSQVSTKAWNAKTIISKFGNLI